MPFLPASLSWAPIITMGSRPGGPSTEIPTVTRPLQPAPGAVMAAPQAMPGLVMPGVRRTPGRPRGGDTRDENDPSPCAGHRVEHMSVRKGPIERDSRVSTRLNFVKHGRIIYFT